LDFKQLLTGWLLGPSASTFGPGIDGLYHLTLLITGLLFVFTQAGLVYFVWRYRRRRNPNATFVHGSAKAEIAWTAFAAAIVITLGLLAQNLWSSLNKMPAQPALTVRVVAEQWLWHFQYAGADGRFETPDDFTVQNAAHLPVGEPILFEVKSLDVIHGFYVPALRIQNDAVPGLTTRIGVQPTREGVFDLRCAQFCGTNHYQMRGEIVVESAESFAAWQKSAKEAVF
jgi:cytochrome c oxidase subunit 2